MSTRAVRSLLALACLAACACTASADESSDETGEIADAIKTVATVNAPKPTGITFGRATRELRASVPIAKKRMDQPKVLASVKLSDLATSEQLLLRGELTLSTCGGKDISGDASDGEENPCSIPQLEASPYGFAPHFVAFIALGRSPGDTGGTKLSNLQDTSCTLREHHCTIAIPQITTKPARDAAEAYVNLVVAADDPGARGFDLMIVERSHVILAVTRIGPGAAPPIDRKATNDSLETGTLDIDRENGDGGPLGVDPKVHHPIYQVKLDGLKPGDVIAADAKLVAKVYDGPSACDAYMSQEILITKDKDGFSGKKPGNEWLTPVNGKNCTDHGGECTFRKSGAVEMGKDTASTMYVTLMATAGRSCVPPGYVWETRNGGSLDVTVRR